MEKKPIEIAAQRIIKPHCKNCAAINQKGWIHPWSGIVERYFWGSWYATVYKKKSNGYYWNVISCSDPKCNAELAVRF